MKMTATQQRDHACGLAKQDPCKALERAREISEPWFKAQALACVARFSEDNTLDIAKEAALVASQCDDEFKRATVKAWEIAALGERGFVTEASSSLKTAIEQSKLIPLLSSRAEALTLLLHASFRLGETEVNYVANELKKSCENGSHWRCKRAIKCVDELLAGKIGPRPFFFS